MTVPLQKTQRSISYKELLDEVAAFAGVLSAEGVSTGDRVIVYMPMVPEALVAMLACARIGAVHCVVFGGFASKELAVRDRRRHSQGYRVRLLRR